MIGLNCAQSGIYTSSSTCIDFNFAVEEMLLNQVAEGQELLFLYENEPAVVLGRFQNPWLECRTGFAMRNGIKIRRRISGGGTVVHGAGNLNWSVISGSPTPKKEVNLHRIIAALGKLGVPVRKNTRHDLLMEIGGLPKKISGSAFRQISRRSMHHGTLLVNANLSTLGNLLRVPERSITACGVASNPSLVANLTDLAPDLSVEKVSGAIAGMWMDAGRVVGPIHPRDVEGEDLFEQSRKRLASEGWIWDRTPGFTESFTDPPNMSNCTVEFGVESGRIASVSIRGPGGDNLRGERNLQVKRDFLNRLIGSPYQGTSFRRRLAGDFGADEPESASELVDYLASGVDGGDSSD